MSFKFVEANSTSLTALDATVEDELEVSGVFIGQTKQEGFMLGNTGSAEADFAVTTSGVNSTINDDVEYSIDDGATWVTTATVSGVKPNGLSERILVRYTPAAGEIQGVGSFLIRVDES